MSCDAEALDPFEKSNFTITLSAFKETYTAPSSPTTMLRSLATTINRNVTMRVLGRQAYPTANFVSWDGKEDDHATLDDGGSITEQKDPSELSSASGESQAKSRKPRMKRKQTRRLTGLTTPIVVDKKLAPILGEERVMSRAQVLKKLNEYAKSRGLISKDVKSYVLDDNLKNVFGKDSVEVKRVGVLKVMNQFLTSPKEHGPNVQKIAENHTEDYLQKRNWPAVVQEREDKRNAGLKRATAQKKTKSGLYIEYKLGNELADFCGADTLTRQGITKLVWKYIKEHNLQDPKNRFYVQSDDKLMKLKGAETKMRFTDIPGMLSKNIEGRA